jgi:sigma-E factor negative regulatory protein RseB
MLLINKQPPAKVFVAAVFLLCVLGSTKLLAFEPLTQSTNDTSEPAKLTTNLSIPETESQSAKPNTENAFDVLSAQAWMHRLANTIDQLSFEISFVVSSPKRETMPYIWRHSLMDDGSSVEQLSLLNGPGFEQIRVNDKVSVFEPGFTPFSIRSSFIDGPIPSAFIHRPDILNEGYDVLLMGRNRVSGRMAQQIRVISKDKSRYQYHLWLDEQTGLLLKQNMYNLKGELLEQIQVMQLSLNNDVTEHFVNIQSDQLPPITATNANEDTILPWAVSFMPVGMQKVTQNLRRRSITGQPAEYMMLSDGLVDVSVYVMQATDVTQEDIAVTTDNTSIVSISDGRIQVTVVGEIPIETASKMANSIVLVSEPQ